MAAHVAFKRGRFPRCENSAYIDFLFPSPPYVSMMKSAKKSLLENSAVFFLLMIVYRLCLDYIYIHEISPVFSYAYLSYNPTTQSRIFSVFTFVVGTAAVCKYKNSEGIFIPQAMMLLYLISFVPMTSFWWCKGQKIDFMLANLVLWLSLFLFTDKIKGIKLQKYFPHNETAVKCIAIVMAFVIIYISAKYTNFRIQLSLNDVYDLRLEARTFNMPIVLLYIWNASSNVLPLMIIYFFSKRYKLLPCILVFIVLLNFSIAGSKSALFKMLICVGVYLFGKREVSKYLPAIFVTFVLIVIVEFVANNSSMLSTMFVRRGLYIPNLLDELYYDYINSNASLLSSPQTELTFAIGDEYFNHQGMRCNNGLFSDAYVHFGWIGVVVYPLVYAFMFQTFEKSFVGNNKNLIFFSALIIVTTLRSSLLTTSLLTHGLLILIFSMMLMSQSRTFKTSHREYGLKA